MSLSVIVLAAGKGTRMNSRLPKVLQLLAGKPLLAHVIDQATSVNASQIITVYGHGGDLVKLAFKDQPLTWVEQAEQLGTGHAVQMVLPVLPTTGFSIILYGDVPLVKQSTLEKLQESAKDGIAMITIQLDNPTGYGRIVREHGKITRIVEQKDATDAEKLITEVNTGVYCVRNDLLHKWLPNLSNNNAQGEFYLTDIVAMANADGLEIGSVEPELAFEIEGVNDRVQLASLERRFQAYQAEQLMKAGVTLLDPSRFDLRGTLTTGKDVSIDVNVIIEGVCHFADGVKIGAGCVIKDATIGSETVVLPYSIIDQSTVGQRNAVGPFARLRPQASLADDVHIGNFVEVKNSVMGQGSKANHLSYIGDADIGKNCNIGAGTITCNYDGAYKHRTTLGDQVFVGSNSSLVAPINIQHGATIGAGSVITKTVTENTLAVARGQQRNIENYARPVKTK